MPQACAICGKGRLLGNNVSHANNRTPKVSRPNLQRIRVKIKGNVRRAMVCTRCIRTGDIQKV